MTPEKLDEFTRAYIEAALWSSTDESDESGGEPMDRNYGPEDLAPETLAAMVADCEQFQTEQAEFLQNDSRTYARRAYGCTVGESAGHDFWLTRNGHGCCFWDGDWTEPAATILTAASKRFGEFTLYVGDDGEIYHC